MKLFIISPGLSAGGAEKNLIWLANKLSQNFKVHLIILTNKSVKQELILDESVNLNILNSKKSFGSTLKLSKLINKEKPDVLISSIINGNFVTSLAKLFSTTNPKHVIRLSTNINNLMKDSFKVKIYTLFSLLLSNQLVILSDNNMDKIQKSLINKITFNKIYRKSVKIELPFEIKKKEVNKDSTDFKAITTSRLVKEKNLDFLIKQIKEFQKKDNLMFYIYGEGPYENQLKKVCIGTENIFFMGHIQMSEINFFEYDVFIFGSTSEGSPNSVIEALSNRLPCLIPSEITDTLPSDLQNISYNYDFGNSLSFQENLSNALFDKQRKEYKSLSNVENVVNMWKEVINSE